MNCLKSFCSPTAIGAAVTAGIGAAAYVAHGVLDITTTKLAQVFYQNCPTNSTLSTVYGALNCTDLGSILGKQDIAVTTLTWTVPVLTAGAGAFCTYKIIKSDLWKNNITQPKSCCKTFCGSKTLAGITCVVGAVTYLVHNIADANVLKMSSIFYKNCPSSGTFQTPYGPMDCGSIASYIAYQDSGSSILAWVMPVITCAGGALAMYQIEKTGCWQNCNRPWQPHRYLPLSTNGGPAGFDDSE